jgi:hypothetical protein
MRANTLLLLHLIAGMAMVGGLLMSAVLATAARRREAGLAGVLRALVWRAALLAVAGSFATIALGEATRAREDVSGRWLDVGSGLGYAGLLLPSIALAVLARRAGARPRLLGWVTVLALGMTTIALATAFVMAAKPA